MNIKDFKVGQTVYVELTGNASRGKTPEQCIEERFRYGSQRDISLEQLREIHGILEGNQED